jgi:hypothetical protein
MPSYGAEIIHKYFSLGSSLWKHPFFFTTEFFV